MAQSINNIEEKRISYKTTNSYSVLNQLNENTKNIWMVFHGMGYLSRYFLKPFTHLNAEENFFIAPQAPSKYYLNDQFKYVGASWLTKENTKEEIENLFSYIDSVAEEEKVFNCDKLILFGFSQGVSIVTRWMASRNIPCEKLVLYAGSIPNELLGKDFDFIDFNNTEVEIIYGNDDEYVSPERLKIEKQKIEKVFKGHGKITYFEGGHVIKPEILKKLI